MKLRVAVGAQNIEDDTIYWLIHLHFACVFVVLNWIFVGRFKFVYILASIHSKCRHIRIHTHEPVVICHNHRLFGQSPTDVLTTANVTKKISLTHDDRPVSSAHLPFNEFHQIKTTDMFNAGARATQ